MRKANLKLIIPFAILAIAGVVYFTSFPSTPSPSRRKYQWKETYTSDSKEPYGTFYIQKLLAEFWPGQQFIHNKTKPLTELLDTSQLKTKATYIFIGQDFITDDSSRVAFFNFLTAGNDAFISTVHLPIDVTNPVFTSYCAYESGESQMDTLKATLNFYHESLKTDSGYTYSFHFKNQDYRYAWRYLSIETYCDTTTSITPLGYITPDKINFIRIPYGKGNLYLHTNPLVFTNYFVIHRDKADYAAGVFSHLSGQLFIWDDVNKIDPPTGDKPEFNPISYILSHESLRYAWWLMLLCALLYTLFTAKRKQRIIPVIEGKANASMEFIQMVSALHFQNGNHKNMARKKMKYFYYFIKSRYGISTQHLTESIIKRLAEKSKVEVNDLKRIALEFKQLESLPFYNAPRLVELYNALDNFYKKCN